MMKLGLLFTVIDTMVIFLTHFALVAVTDLKTQLKAPEG